MKYFCSIIIGLVLFLIPVNVLPQDKILFLDFQFVKGVPELIRLSTVNGRLKARQYLLQDKPGFSVTVLSNERVLYRNHFNDPSEMSFEYFRENGEIKRTAAQKDTIFYSARVPYSENIDKILLRKISSRALSKSSSASGEVYEFEISHDNIKMKE